MDITTENVADASMYGEASLPDLPCLPCLQSPASDQSCPPSQDLDGHMQTASAGSSYSTNMSSNEYTAEIDESHFNQDVLSQAQNYVFEPSQLQGSSANNAVFHRLDNILREKVDLEIQQFKSSLHETLDEQYAHVHRLLQLSQTSDEAQLSQVNLSPQRSFQSVFPVSHGEDSKKQCIDMTEGFKNELLLRLLTANTVLCNTLHRNN